MKQCKDCKIIKPFEDLQKHPQSADGYNSLCLECNRERVKRWRKQNPEKRAEQVRKEGKQPYTKNKCLKATYGITLDEYNSMFSEQGGCCKICKLHQSEFSRALAVDHCHRTGKIRGLLCSNCNTVLGMAKDDIEILKTAINYLAGY